MERRGVRAVAGVYSSAENIQEAGETQEFVAEIPVEYASQRKIRERNKLYYRFNHWPIWIFVFFIAPGPLTFDLFERGFDSRMALWLGAVLVGTGIAGLRGRLPGVEPKPYIIRFTEDRPESALSARLLHVRVERGDHVRGAEHRRASSSRS